MKKFISVIILCAVLVTCVFSVPACAYQLSGFEVNAEGVMLISLDTKDVLYSKNIDKKLYPASLTKIMTAALVLSNCKDLDNEIVTVSEEAINSLSGTGSSMGGLVIGEQLTVHQLLYYLLMSSANDSANVLAEHFGGSVSGFVNMMNLKAKELGMESTHYINPHGLHDLEHYTTVRDMSVLMQYVLQFDVFKEITSSKRYSMPATNKQRPRTLVTTVFLLDEYNSVSPSYYYKYATGTKTGYTDEAGRCLISTASKGGYNYLCILMHSPVTNADGKMVRYEFPDTKMLYEWAFNNFEYKQVVDTDTPVAEAKVDLCWDRDFVPLMLEGGLSAILPKEADSSTVIIKPHTDKEVFDAPLKKGQKLGTADIIYAGETLGTVNLVSGATLDANIFLKVAKMFKNIFRSKIFLGIVILVAVIIVAFIIATIILNSPRSRRKRRYRSKKRR